MAFEARERFLEAEQSRLAAGLVAATALIIAPFLLPAFQTSLLITVILFAVLSTAFNLLYGYTGLLSFGHGMFVATAAYGTAKVFRIIGPEFGFDAMFGGASVLVTFFVGMLVGTLLATLLAVFVGFLSVRLEEIYFAMITLSFSMAIWAIFQKNVSGQFGALIGYRNLLSSNGSDGLTIPYAALGEVNLFGLKFKLLNITGYNAFYLIVLAVSAASMYALWRIVRSPFGTVCRAIRENPERARALGINTRFHSWMTFIISGAFSGLVGTMYGPLQSNVNPGYAHWTFSAEPVIMTVMGGPFSFVGPLIGAVVFEYLRWGISQFPALEAHWQLVFGVILLVVVLYFDNGIAGGLERLQAWLTVARDHYREDGVTGVATHTRTSIVALGRDLRAAVVDQATPVRTWLGDRVEEGDERTGD